MQKSNKREFVVAVEKRFAFMLFMMAVALVALYLY
jgi:hypothetical protein